MFLFTVGFVVGLGVIYFLALYFAVSKMHKSLDRKVVLRVYRLFYEFMTMGVVTTVCMALFKMILVTPDVAQVTNEVIFMARLEAVLLVIIYTLLVVMEVMFLEYLKVAKNKRVRFIENREIYLKAMKEADYNSNRIVNLLRARQA